MRILWLARAQRELVHIHDYITAENPQAAVTVVRRIHSAIAGFSDVPGIGRPGRLSNTRELVVTGTPFIVPYRVQDGMIEILGIIHSARKWPDSI